MLDDADATFPRAARKSTNSVAIAAARAIVSTIGVTARARAPGRVRPQSRKRLQVQVLQADEQFAARRRLTRRQKSHSCPKSGETWRGGSAMITSFDCSAERATQGSGL